MLKFFKSATIGASSSNGTSSDKAATAPSDSRLNNLLAQAPAKAIGALDVDTIDALSVPKRKADVEEASAGRGKSLKRPRPGSTSSFVMAGSSAESVDITVSPPALPAVPAKRSRWSGSSLTRGGGAIDSTDCYGRHSESDTGLRSLNDFSGGRGSTSESEKWSSLTREGRGSIRGGGGLGAPRSGSTIGGSKSGPRTARLGERAICAEQGYDPLELMHDANVDLFGNAGFRGIQEEVSKTEGNARC